MSSLWTGISEQMWRSLHWSQKKTIWKCSFDIGYSQLINILWISESSKRPWLYFSLISVTPPFFCKHKEHLHIALMSQTFYLLCAWNCPILPCEHEQWWMARLTSQRECVKPCLYMTVMPDDRLPAPLSGLCFNLQFCSTPGASKFIVGASGEPP